MGRNSKIANLPIEKQMQVDQCIHAHRYISLNGMMITLRELGITTVSRSALGRYVAGLRERDALHAQPEEGTLVTIVERSTGEVRIVKTCASGLAVAALIEKISTAA